MSTEDADTAPSLDNKPLPELLYHYTRAESLLGILSNSSSG